MNSNTKNLIATIVGVILIAGVLTVPLAFDHQSADARNVKVKSVKNNIMNKIQAITRAAGTGNDGISSDGSSGTGTNGNPGSSTNGVPGTEGSRGIVIALPGVERISDSTGASGASGIGCIGASCNGGAGAAGGVAGSNFGLSGSVSGGSACQQVVSGAQACSTGTGGGTNGGSSGPGGAGGIGIGGTGGKAGDASGGVGGLGG